MILAKHFVTVFMECFLNQSHSSGASSLFNFVCASFFSLVCFVVWCPVVIFLSSFGLFLVFITSFEFPIAIVSEVEG